MRVVFFTRLEQATQRRLTPRIPVSKQRRCRSHWRTLICDPDCLGACQKLLRFADPEKQRVVMQLP